MKIEPLAIPQELLRAIWSKWDRQSDTIRAHSVPALVMYSQPPQLDPQIIASQNWDERKKSNKLFRVIKDWDTNTYYLEDLDTI